MSTNQDFHWCLKSKSSLVPVKPCWKPSFLQAVWLAQVNSFATILAWELPDQTQTTCRSTTSTSTTWGVDGLVGPSCMSGGAYHSTIEVYGWEEHGGEAAQEARWEETRGFPSMGSADHGRLRVSLCVLFPVFIKFDFLEVKCPPLLLLEHGYTNLNHHFCWLDLKLPEQKVRFFQHH